MKDPQPAQEPLHLWRSLGPAIIVASVVLGPGSILSSSKVGWQHGFSMTWVVLIAAVLMFGMTAVSARLGVFLKGTLCTELAVRLGRPVAIVTGATLFLIAACFQFGNNLGVLYGIEPLLETFNPVDAAEAVAAKRGEAAQATPVWLPVVVLVAINAGVIVALYGFRELYKPVETLMKVLVGLMIFAFAINLIWSLVARLTGQLTFPEAAPAADSNVATSAGDALMTVLALIATTFSVGGAFYQSYLVRQKGWTPSDLRQGLFDSLIGITTLAVVTLMIMCTAATVLHPNPEVKALSSAADVARQLRPLFGPLATVIFCAGIFAGAFSSFLVNAMIGGAVLSDGIGAGGAMDNPWTKGFTVVGLLMGMGIAIGMRTTGLEIGNLIIFAQALTVLGNPLLAGALVYLMTRPELRARNVVPGWMQGLAFFGFGVVLLLSLRTVYNLYVKLAS